MSKHIISEIDIGNYKVTRIGEINPQIPLNILLPRIQEELLEKQFSCLKQCQGIITSDLAMAHKPSSKIFYYACEVVDVEPNQSVFIDDTKINVLKAEKLGFNAHHYQSETELNIFLSKLFNLK